MTENMHDEAPRRHDNHPAFDIDGRIGLKIDRDLAVALSELILNTDTKNPALLALAHQLHNLSKR